MSKQIFKRIGFRGKKSLYLIFLQPPCNIFLSDSLADIKAEYPWELHQEIRGRISIFSSRPCTRIQRTPALLKTKMQFILEGVNLANRYVSLQTALVGFQTKETGYRTQSKNIIKWQRLGWFFHNWQLLEGTKRNKTETPSFLLKFTSSSSQSVGSPGFLNMLERFSIAWPVLPMGVVETITNLYQWKLAGKSFLLLLVSLFKRYFGFVQFTNNDLLY